RAVARECLNRRIPTIELLEKEVLAIIEERRFWRGAGLSHIIRQCEASGSHFAPTKSGRNFRPSKCRQRACNDRKYNRRPIYEPSTPMTMCEPLCCGGLCPVASCGLTHAMYFRDVRHNCRPRPQHGRFQGP